ncbi:MAG: flavodoxin family protein [Promethearchaeota archaeon]|nr:MAG: flavodoxin family protein [Candidatus Lokiarchaeota archaeon]
MKVLIVYDTKYGNTEKVAQLIGEGIASAKGNEVIVTNVKDVNLKKEDSYDLILIGSPVHFGKHVGSVKKFINKLPKSKLKIKAYSVFNTYMGGDSETTEVGVCSYTKMLEKIEEQLSKIMPDLTKASSGLSIKVEGMKGPIVNEDLPNCKDFGIKLLQVFK